MQNLIQILHDLPFEFEGNLPGDAIQVTGVEFDSRKIKPGNLFVAMKGENSDGHRFIPDAIKSGAAAVVGTEIITDLEVPYIRVIDTRETLAWISASFYDHPARRLTVIGVTGTDGKTTTSSLIFQILKEAGIKAGLISTVNAVIMDKEIDTGFHVTTPEANDIQKYLRMMVNEGLTHVVLETTSHGLAQHRVTGCEYDIAVVTNVTHEHLDYHKSYSEYLKTKGKLFEMLSQTGQKQSGHIGISILNADDQSYEYLKSVAPGPAIRYSIQGRGDLNAESIIPHQDGITFTAVGKGASFHVDCPIPGEFNVSNCLAAIGATVFGLGISTEAAREGIGNIQGVPGRMEQIRMGQDFTAIVDFAHTPNALEQALKTVRQMTTRKVIAVFGSAGLRDREKRKLMAVVSTHLADISIFTAEDPRTESLDGILEEMSAAAVAAGGVEGRTFFRIPDRSSAIQFGVDLAQPGDLVASFGKGHEQSMCFGTTEYPWDDRTAMKAAVAGRMKISGPQMPVLPTSPVNK